MVDEGADKMLQLRVLPEALLRFLPGCFAMLNDAFHVQDEVVGAAFDCVFVTDFDMHFGFL
ncbi:MAG: hypothetical protein ACJ8LD_19835 [Pantoea agglomerans]